MCACMLLYDPFPSKLIYNMTHFRTNVLTQPQGPRLCVRTKCVLTWCSLFDSFLFDVPYDYFQKNNVLTFLLKLWVQDVCKDRTCACIIS